VNLVTNAVHATEGLDRTYTDRLVTVKSYFNNKEVCISIKDNGYGIDEAIMEKIFIPFFTTKGVGEGTGLGLSISMGIIEEHQGHIEVLTEKNIGTEFIIHLPRLENTRQDSIAG
jgi:two-component system NtrC family sensor kinase